MFLPLVIKGNTHVFPFSVGQPGEAGSADPAEETQEMKTKHSTVYLEIQHYVIELATLSSLPFLDLQVS